MNESLLLRVPGLCSNHLAPASSFGLDSLFSMTTVEFNFDPPSWTQSLNIVFSKFLRVIVRENQADDERWGSADSHHIFAVRYPYPIDSQGNILFSIALIGFEYDHPPDLPPF